MWHVSFRSGVATLRTAIHLLLTSLLLEHCYEYKVSRKTLTRYKFNPLVYENVSMIITLPTKRI